MANECPDRTALERAHRFLKTDLTIEAMLMNDAHRIVLARVALLLQTRRSNLQSRPLRAVDQLPPDAKKRQANDVD